MSNNIDLTQIAPGTQVIVRQKGADVIATFRGVSAKYAGYGMVEFSPGRAAQPRKIKSVATEADLVAEDAGATTVTPANAPAAVVEAPVIVNPVSDIPINERFSYLDDMVDLVSTSIPTSLILCGSGGLGKSYTVFSRLVHHGLEEDVDFVVVKGFSTPKSMYRTLYENRDRIVVFDDCDSVLKNDTAVNLLKGALDTTPVRRISWKTERSGSDEDLPEVFDFEGKVIFISNMTLDRIPQALLSRSIYVDVSMTAGEKIERMRAIAPQVKPSISLESKLEVIDMLEELNGQVKDLNLRTMLKVCDIRAGLINSEDPERWKKIARYVVTTGVDA